MNMDILGDFLEKKWKLRTLMPEFVTVNGVMVGVRQPLIFPFLEMKKSPEIRRLLDTIHGLFLYGNFRFFCDYT